MIGFDGPFGVNDVGDVLCARSVPSLAIEFSVIFFGMEVEVVGNAFKIAARWALQSFGFENRWSFSLGKLFFDPEEYAFLGLDVSASLLIPLIDEAISVDIIRIESISVLFVLVQEHSALIRIEVLEAVLFI